MQSLEPIWLSVLSPMPNRPFDRASSRFNDKNANVIAMTSAMTTGLPPCTASSSPRPRRRTDRPQRRCSEIIRILHDLENRAARLRSLFGRRLGVLSNFLVHIIGINQAVDDLVERAAGKFRIAWIIYLGPFSPPPPEKVDCFLSPLVESQFLPLHCPAHIHCDASSPYTCEHDATNSRPRKGSMLKAAPTPQGGPRRHRAPRERVRSGPQPASS